MSQILSTARVAPHMTSVASVALIIAQGLTTQRAVNRVDGALMGIGLTEFKKATDFPELADGLVEQKTKLTKKTGYHAQVLDRINDALTLVDQLKQAFDVTAAKKSGEATSIEPHIAAGANGVAADGQHHEHA